MAKGITDVGKFVRGVLIREMQIPENQPWTVRKAADLVAYLMMVSKDPVNGNAGANVDTATATAIADYESMFIGLPGLHFWLWLWLCSF